MTNIRVFAVLGVVALAPSACGGGGGGGGGDDGGATGMGGYGMGGYVPSGVGGAATPGAGGTVTPGAGGTVTPGAGGTVTPGAGGAATVCTPGSTQACVGPGACSGAQTCSADGSIWGACDCGQGVGGTPGGVGGGAALGGAAGTPGLGGAGGAGGEPAITDLVWEFYQDLSGWDLDPYASTDPPVGTTVTWADTSTCDGQGYAAVSVPLDAVDQIANFRFYSGDIMDLSNATIEMDICVEAGAAGGIQIFVATGAPDYGWASAWINLSSLDAGLNTVSVDASTLTGIDLTAIESWGLQVAAGDTAASWSNPTVLLVDEVRITGAVVVVPPGTGGAGGAAGGTGVGGSAGTPGSGGAAGTPAGGAAGDTGVAGSAGSTGTAGTAGTQATAGAAGTAGTAGAS